MAEANTQRRRFTFSLRTLLILVSVVGVLLATVPLLMMPRTEIFSGPWHPSEYRGEDGEPIWVGTVVEPEAKWKMVALGVDAATIGLAIWLIWRGHRAAKP